MAKPVDIGSKRLVSLAPTAWARWCTGDASIEAVEILSGDFQWVARATDVLLKVTSPVHGEFLLPCEIQTRPQKRMPRRLNAYAALAEERYDLAAYPVLVNILPPTPGMRIASRYESSVLDLSAFRTFRVLNLWEVDVNLVFTQNLATLLPFTPILKGGGSGEVLSKTVALLRADQSLAELETLLAFFATFVLDVDVVTRIMRWDMAVLRESPWYTEILAEGMERGLERGMERGLERGREAEATNMVLMVIRHRFGAVSPATEQTISQLSLSELRSLVDIVLDAATLDEVLAAVDAMADE